MDCPQSDLTSCFLSKYHYEESYSLKDINNNSSSYINKSNSRLWIRTALRKQIQMEPYQRCNKWRGLPPASQKHTLLSGHPNGRSGQQPRQGRQSNHMGRNLWGRLPRNLRRGGQPLSLQITPSGFGMCICT